MAYQNQPYDGNATTGFASPADDYRQERISLDRSFIKHKNATFFFDMDNDSMIGCFIMQNSTLVIDRLMNAKNGSIVLAVVDGEFTVRRYVRKGTDVILAPENSKYRPVYITEGTSFEIWGVVSYIIINGKEV